MIILFLWFKSRGLWEKALPYSYPSLSAYLNDWTNEGQRWREAAHTHTHTHSHPLLTAPPLLLGYCCLLLYSHFSQLHYIASLLEVGPHSAPPWKEVTPVYQLHHFLLMSYGSTAPPTLTQHTHTHTHTFSSVTTAVCSQGRIYD